MCPEEFLEASLENLVRKESFLLFLDMLHDIGTEIGHAL